MKSRHVKLSIKLKESRYFIRMLKKRRKGTESGLISNLAEI